MSLTFNIDNDSSLENRFNYEVLKTCNLNVPNRVTSGYLRGFQLN